MICKIGDRVGYKLHAEHLNRDEDPSFGVVSDLTVKGMVVVTWDDKWFNSHEPNPIDPDSLMLEADIVAAQSILEQNFQLYQQQVKSKVQEAVSTLKEAIELANKAGCHVSDMMYKSVMRDVIYDLGWSGSSFSC
jgi:hypothetical protein